MNINHRIKRKLSQFNLYRKITGGVWYRRKDTKKWYQPVYQVFIEYDSYDFYEAYEK